jgi:hypothetical protein
MSDCVSDRGGVTLASTRQQPQEGAEMRTRITISIIGALAALALVAVPAASAATNVHRATLSGSQAFPGVNGKAKFQVDNGVRELEAQIEDANALAGKTVRFRVDGKLVGSATVNALGTARIRRTGATVPPVHTGSTIRVRRPSGVLVASGRFN